MNSLYLSGWACCSPDPGLAERLGIDPAPPDGTAIPTAIRRRTSMAVRLALTSGLQACRRAGVDPTRLPAVFASAGSEMQVTNKLCIEMAKPEGWVSPTQFHNSVHNAAAGYWSIATGCQLATTSMAAAEATLAMAWVESWSRLATETERLLLVCYDELWPQHLQPGMGLHPVAAAWVLATQASGTAVQADPPARTGLALGSDLARWVKEAPPLAAVPLLRALDSRIESAEVPLGAGWSLSLQRTGKKP